MRQLARLRSEERRVGKECRLVSDWSSDVCSSDLSTVQAASWLRPRAFRHARKAFANRGDETTGFGRTIFAQTRFLRLIGAQSPVIAASTLGSRPACGSSRDLDRKSVV